MSKTITIPASGDSFSAQFPDKCVYCGQPKSVEIKLDVAKTEERDGKKIKYAVQLFIPYCAVHESELKRNNAVISRSRAIAFVPSLVFFLYIAIFAMAPATGVLIAIAAAIGVATIVGALFAFLIKLALRPVYPSLWDTPIWSGTLGVSAEFAQGNAALEIHFSNPAIADEFEQLNQRLSSLQKLGANYYPSNGERTTTHIAQELISVEVPPAIRRRNIARFALIVFIVVIVPFVLMIIGILFLS